MTSIPAAPLAILQLVDLAEQVRRAGSGPGARPRGRNARSTHAPPSPDWSWDRSSPASSSASGTGSCRPGAAGRRRRLESDRIRPGSHSMIRRRTRRTAIGLLELLYSNATVVPPHRGLTGSRGRIGPASRQSSAKACVAGKFLRNFARPVASILECTTRTTPRRRESHPRLTPRTSGHSGSSINEEGGPGSLRAARLSRIRRPGRRQPARVDRSSERSISSLLGLGQGHEPARCLARLDVERRARRTSPARSWNSLTLVTGWILRSRTTLVMTSPSSMPVGLGRGSPP